jgi:hypothetical protein
MTTRLYGYAAIEYVRTNELDDILVRDTEGNWRWTGLDDALDAQWAAEQAGEPEARVVMIDAET